ncbi:MAG: hypothetical protein HOP07_17600 [Bacteriovoracaceae bacterium]|nr:hypothetical protein [Bacteriovoracaceae bacterium]
MKLILSISLLALVLSSCGHHGHKGCSGSCKEDCKDSKQCDMKGKAEGYKCHSEKEAAPAAEVAPATKQEFPV